MKSNRTAALLKDAAILFAITLIAGILLGLFNDMTKDKIAERAAQEKQEACQAVMTDAAEFAADESWQTLGTDAVPDAVFDGTTGTVAFNDKATCRVTEVLDAKNAAGESIGYVVGVTSKNGYGGDIELLVGVTGSGSVTGVEILSMSESPGLGDNAKNPEFRAQYVTQPGQPFVVVKGGASADHEIDALSGATITSRAVTHAVNAALGIAQSLAQ